MAILCHFHSVQLRTHFPASTTTLPPPASERESSPHCSATGHTPTRAMAHCSVTLSCQAAARMGPVWQRAQDSLLDAPRAGLCVTVNSLDQITARCTITRRPSSPASKAHTRARCHIDWPILIPLCCPVNPSDGNVPAQESMQVRHAISKRSPRQAPVRRIVLLLVRSMPCQSLTAAVQY